MVVNLASFVPTEHDPIQECSVLHETFARTPPTRNGCFGVACGGGRLTISNFAANTRLDPTSVTLPVSKPASLSNWTEANTSNSQTTTCGATHSFDRMDFAYCASGITISFCGPMLSLKRSIKRCID